MRLSRQAKVRASYSWVRHTWVRAASVAVQFDAFVSLDSGGASRGCCRCWGGSGSRVRRRCSGAGSGSSSLLLLLAAYNKGQQGLRQVDSGNMSLR